MNVCVCCVNIDIVSGPTAALMNGVRRVDSHVANLHYSVYQLGLDPCAMYMVLSFQRVLCAGIFVVSFSEVFLNGNVDHCTLVSLCTLLLSSQEKTC